MSCFSASTLDKRARPNSKGKRQCRSPRGNHGSVLKHGCIQSTCINRKWTPTMRTDICCFKNKPNMPNTVIENIAGDCNTTTTISCTEGGQLSFTHSGGQVEQLAAEIEDLKDQSAQQFTDLKELIEKHVEGLYYPHCAGAYVPFARRHVCVGCDTAVSAQNFMAARNGLFDGITNINHVFGLPNTQGNGYGDYWYQGILCCKNNQIPQRTWRCVRPNNNAAWVCNPQGMCKSVFTKDNGHFEVAECLV